MSSAKRISNEEIEATPIMKEISTTLKKLVELCKAQPEASMICSICLPDQETINDPEGQDSKIINIYAGDSVSQIQQFNCLANSNPQFLSDLTMFLELRIKKQMEKVGSTGNKQVDDLLNSFTGSELPN